jgi:hypothetical protein
MLFFNIEKLQEEFIRLDAQTTLISDAKKKKTCGSSFIYKAEMVELLWRSCLMNSRAMGELALN